MSRLLAHVLARHRDQPLTVDVARQIIAAMEADFSIDPSRFGTERVGGYTLQCERVAGIEHELEPLHRGYRQAVNPHLGDVAYPYAELREAERAGSVIQATARQGATRELVGVMRVRVFKRTDCDHLGLLDDTFYVAPEHRVPNLATALWRFCEKAAFAHGVREAEIRTNRVTEGMARFFGYRKVATIHQKVAHDASDYTRAPKRQGVVHESLAPHRV